MEGTTAGTGRRRYLILCAALVLLCTAQTLWGGRTGDFWERAAVARELATHPFSPRHPTIVSDAPHAFVSPYALLVGLASRATGVDAVPALYAMGIVNLVLLLVGFRWFVSATFRRQDADVVAFYGLLFWLLLWGYQPWNWSGFFHLRQFAGVLPYESTFAAALLFIALSGYAASLRNDDRRFPAVLLLILAFVLVSHPLTAIAIFVGCAAFCVSAGGPHLLRNLALLGGTIAASFLLAFAWPYYPVFELLTEQHPEFRGRSVYLYEGILVRLGPAVIGLVPLLRRVREKLFDPLGLMFAGFGVLYLYGALTSNWSYGRLLAWIAFILQLCAAGWMAEWEARLRSGERAAKLAYAGMCAVVLVFSVLPVRDVVRSLSVRQSSYDAYRFLSSHTGQYEVVLSDVYTSWRVPALGGKVVASKNPIFFIDDEERRRQDVRHFFSDEASAAERAEILRRYDVDWVLINRANLSVSPQTLRALEALGESVYAAGDLELIEVGNATS